MELDGRILLLGCDHDTVTFLHYTEHVADFPGKRVARYRVPVLKDGVRVWRGMEEFDTSSAGVHPNWPDRFFARIADAWLAQNGNPGGKVGDAECALLESRSLHEFAAGVMRAVAVDPRAADRV
jgi:aminoglycoside 3-N-acetyltransferase